MNVSQRECRSADGAPIRFWQSGSGRPLLIVPGTSTDPRGWDGVREGLEPHVTVSVMERRAIVGDPMSQLDMEREFEDVAAVSAALADDVDVLGHSSGALCVMGAALRPNSFRRVFLFEPPLEDDPAPYQPAMEKMWERLKAGDVDGVYDTWLKQYVGIPAEPAEALKGSPVGDCMRPYAQYLPREMASHLAYTWDVKAFGAVQTPSVYITGSNTVGNEQLRGWMSRLEAVMPNFSVREIPEQDHFAPILAPQEFTAFVVDCLSDGA